MCFPIWLRSRSEADAGRHDRVRRPSAKPRRLRPRLEALEGRDMPSTLTVTNTLDSGHGSLRYEIAVAERHPAKDMIAFNIPKKDPGYDPGTGRWTITLTTGELDITTGVTIQGPGASLVTISGDGRSRVFEVAPNVTAAFSGLTISGGTGVAGGLVSLPGDGDGGGILNAGNLTLSGCTLSGNHAPGHFPTSRTSNGGGGGIYNTGTLRVAGNSIVTGNYTNWNGGGINNTGTLAVNDSSVSANTADGQGGGGINNAGSLSVSNSSVSGNNARLGGGGGILNSGTLTVSNNSTLSGNSADEGGGFFNEGTATIVGSTVTGNNAPFPSFSPPVGSGGGIYNSGSLTVSDCNLSNNVVGPGGEGGGIYNAGTAAALTVSGSTFSGNSPDNIFGPYTDAGGDVFA